MSKPTSANPTVLETLQAYGGAQNPVNRGIPQDFQMISTSGRFWGAGAGELPLTQKQVPHRAFSPIRNDNALGLGALNARNSMAFRSEHRRHFPAYTLFATGLRQSFLRQPRTEDKKLRKDPFGGPCFEGTLRKLFCFPNEVPWPGRLRALLLPPSKT